MIAEPGSPQLSTAPHTSTRSEAEARIAMALSVARHASWMARRRHSDPWILAAALEDAVDRIIDFLEGGKS